MSAVTEDYVRDEVEAVLDEYNVSDSELRKEALEMASKGCFDFSIRGGTDVIIASSVYTACLLHNKKTSQKEIGELCGVSHSSVGRVYKELVYHVKDIGRDPNAETEQLIAGEIKAGVPGTETAHLLKVIDGRKETLCGRSGKHTRKVTETSINGICGRCLKIKRGKI